MRVLIFSLIMAMMATGSFIGWRAGLRELGDEAGLGDLALYVLLGAVSGFGACMALVAAWQLAGML